jgi:hypothetical protein
MLNYMVTGPGFVLMVRADSHGDALQRVAAMLRVNPLMLCVERAR